MRCRPASRAAPQAASVNAYTSWNAFSLKSLTVRPTSPREWGPAWDGRPAGSPTAGTGCHPGRASQWSAETRSVLTSEPQPPSSRIPDMCVRHTSERDAVLVFAGAGVLRWSLCSETRARGHCVVLPVLMNRIVAPPRSRCSAGLLAVEPLPGSPTPGLCRPLSCPRRCPLQNGL